MHCHFIIVVLCAVVCQNVPFTLGNSLTGTTEETLNNLLQNYNKGVRPFLGVDILNVDMCAYINPWFEINPVTMEFSTIIIVAQNWTDRRLIINESESEHQLAPLSQLTLSGDLANKIWQPDTVIFNEHKSHVHFLTQPSLLVKISPNGRISSDLEISVTTGCRVHKNTAFPFDTFCCSVDFGSYSSDDIYYNWLSHEDEEIALENSVIEDDEFHAVGFYIDSIEEKIKYTEQFDLFGPRRLMSIEFCFRRPLSPYVTKCFIPLSMFVLLSIVSLGTLKPEMSILANFFCIALLNIYMSLVTQSGKDFSWIVRKTSLDRYFSMCAGFIITTFFVSLIKLSIEKFKQRTQTEAIEMEGMGSSDTNRRFEARSQTGQQSPNNFDAVNLVGSSAPSSSPQPRSQNTDRTFQYPSCGQMWSSSKTMLMCLENASWILAAIFACANAIYWAVVLQMHAPSHETSSIVYANHTD